VRAIGKNKEGARSHARSLEYSKGEGEQEGSKTLSSLSSLSRRLRLATGGEKGGLSAKDGLAEHNKKGNN